MSGRKEGEFDDNVAAMAEALRQAEERQRREEAARREAQRQAAEQRFRARAAVLEARWRALRDAGLGALAGWALDDLDARRGRLAGQPAEQIEREGAAAAERDALIAHAAQTFRSLGERGLAGALASLPPIGSDADLRAALAQTRAAGSAVQDYLAVLQQAREGLAFVDACVAARLTPDDDVVAARAEVEAFLGEPTLAVSMRIGHAIARLRPVHLAQRLEDRRRTLAQGLDVLCEPGRRPLLEAWREGFVQALADLRAALVRGDWPAAAPTLRELESFLDARAQGRLQLLTRAARDAGFATSEPAQAGAGTWTAGISDAQGLLFSVTEGTPDWFAPGRLNATLQIRGPADFDGPRCMTSGLREVHAQLHRQGVALRVRDDTGRELLAPAPVSELPKPVGHRPALRS